MSLTRSKIMRIIDVNYNRATEGLRVVEEIGRFILEDKKATLALKQLRGELRKTTKLLGQRLSARNSEQDIGREMFTKSEGQRTSLLDIFQSNIKRAEEAGRCLEEFSKLISPLAGKKFKALRFKLYIIERKIYPRLVKWLKLDFDLYVVTDPKIGHQQTIRSVLQRGVKAVQLRDKGLNEQAYYQLAKPIARLAHQAQATFIVNDHWRLVERLGADGVHLGQEDLAKVSLAKVRKIIGEDKLIGVSTHSFKQAKQAVRQGADYISVGPIFATPSKPQTKPVGLKLLKQVLRKVKIPVVAIGGIDKNTVKKVLAIGCQRFAAIRNGVTLSRCSCSAS